ncbi:MAG: Ig-like domain-containing protein [Bacteroidales bacterium]|nr:Ig-like domain-containing protein [Bacteroidales bacterium]
MMRKLVFITALTLLFAVVYGQSELFRADLKSTQANNPKAVNSNISMDIPFYQPGSTVDLIFTYNHIVPDIYTEEYTAGISLDFPQGVNVNSADNLSLHFTYTGPNWNGETGNGALTTWGLMDGGPAGEGSLRTTQDFKVNVTIDESFTGNFDVDWHIVGDRFIQAPPPHSATGTLTLTESLTVDLAVLNTAPSLLLSGESAYPEVTILNYGSDIANNFLLSVVINDGTSDVYSSTKSISGDLASQVTQAYTMDELWSPADGTHTITTSVALTGDTNNANDELTSECLVLNIIAYTGNVVTGKYLGVDLSSGSLNELGEFGAAVLPMAEEWDGTNVYRVYENFKYGTVNAHGIYTEIGTFTGFSGGTMPTGLAYDHKNEVMYLSTLNSAYSSKLYTANLTSGTLTPIGTGTGASIIALDLANDGFLYGPAFDDKLYKIDPTTGSQTLIGDIGIHIDFIQDVSYDIENNRLYTVTCGGLGGIYDFGYYDITTGTFNSIADMGGQQHSTFVIKQTHIGPLPVSFNPVDMATDVTLDAPVSVSFDENIFATDLTGISISPDPGNVSASIASNVLTIAHDSFAYNTEYTVTIPNASINDGSNDLNFDIKWTFTTELDPEACNTPSDIIISDITASNATVSWSENGAGTEWIVAYGSVGFNPDTDGTTVTANTTTRIINNLSQLTIYEVYVKANCGAETSTWAGPVNFTTPHDCNAAISSFPYATNFDEAEPCWTINQTNPNETWKWESKLGSTQYTCYYDDALGLQDEWLITPEFDFSEISDNIAVAFSWKGSYGYSVSPYDNYDMLFKVSTNGTEWTTLWDETEVGVFENLSVIYTTTVNVSAFAGESSVWFAFNYYGSDAAQWIITDFAVDFISSSDSKLEDISTITVYPNPANNLITVTNAENENIIILNMLGEIVANINNATSNQTIDISNLSNGTYFVKVNSEVFKIIVVK